jgi:U32 family peptidase
MQELIDAAKSAGINAIIASDMAVIEYAYKAGVEIHASTQLNISNYEAVKFFSKYCQVMVLARELTLQQTAEICRLVKENDLKGPDGNSVLIELFVHGALCMSISGKCYLSLHENNHSANRGSCYQNCRRSYKVTEKDSGYELEIDNEYIMSPKDLCTIHFLDRILDAGVSVLKIEGRARAPEYVKTTTLCYHEAVEAWKTKSFSKEKISEWIKLLKTVYNRGFWEGYYLGDKLGQWSGNYGSIATRKKIHIGKVTNFFKNIQVAEILLETGELQLSDNLLIIGPSTGVVESKINEIRLKEKAVTSVIKGNLISIPIPTLVRRNDKVYKWVDDI